MSGARIDEGYQFEVQTHMLGEPYDTAYAEDADQAFCAVVTLLQDQGLGPGGEASVLNLATGEYVWCGNRPYRVTKGGRDA